MKITNKLYNIEEELAATEIELWELEVQLSMPKWYMVYREEIELKAEKVRVTNKLKRLSKELANELELQKRCEDD